MCLSAENKKQRYLPIQETCRGILLCFVGKKFNSSVSSVSIRLSTDSMSFLASLSLRKGCPGETTGCFRSIPPDPIGYTPIGNDAGGAAQA